MDAATSGLRREPRKKTTAQDLGDDVLCMIFALLDLIQLIRCSAVCHSWRKVIDKLKLLQVQYLKDQQQKHNRITIDTLHGSLNEHLEQLAMNQHKFSLQEGPADIFQWKGHSVQVNQCRMKRGLILTGVGDKVMRLWSAESYKCLDEYFLLDKAPLIDYDFDEIRVVGLVGTRVCIWTRTEPRNIFLSRQNMFTKGICMRYVDPEAVIGCEDGKVRVYDMYSRKCSRIIKMHAGPVTCLCFSDDQLLVSGSSLGSLSLSDLSSDQRVATLGSTSSAGIKTLCLNPQSHLLFAGSSAGYASCWDLRMMKRLWEARVSPNAIYSMNHLQNDRSSLVVGGVDGVVRVVDQDRGEVLSRCIMGDTVAVVNRATGKFGTVERREVKRLAEDARIDLMPTASRPPITCLAVGMQKVVTTHNDKYIRIWKFRN